VRRVEGYGDGGGFLPSAVLFMTWSRRTSPVEIEESCGKRWISLSLCVPFPTPGAPTRMTRAAFLSFLAVVVKVIATKIETARETGEDAGRRPALRRSDRDAGGAVVKCP
jgi:hypothetical protein